MSEDIPSGYSEADIAIVGMAAHLPGASSIEQYWKNLVSGTESVVFYSDEELIEAGVPKSHLRHPKYVKAGAPLEGMADFDGDIFGFSPKECAILDPQHRHFLECAWEALEDAGHPPDRFDGPVGVFGGCGMGSYFYFNLCSNPELVDSVGMFLLRHTGNDKDFLSTRVSHTLNLTGPSVNVQTACSTSLVAVHYAAQALASYECDLALAGGVTIELPHRHGYFFKDGEILSPDGHCHAFDHRSQGTIFGSGAGIVALRRLPDALEEGDHIYAVIRGSAINNDGAAKAGYLAPSVQGQAACIVEAHTLADVDPRSIGYVECHGTGTFLGDPIEVSALTEAFRQGTEEKGFCKIGSVKTNIGHLDTAAGVASLIKSALILEREQIPPTLGFEKPNPTIDFESSPFEVNHQLTPWPKGDAPRRAGVQSLGVGGTNAHVILQEAPPKLEAAPESEGPHLFLLSAKSRAALEGNAKNLADHLAEHSEQALDDVSWTLLNARTAFERRRPVAASTREEAISILRGDQPRRVFSHVAIDDPSVALLFPGGGAQYAQMGKDLYANETVFRDTMDQAFRYLGAHPEVDFDLQALLYETDSPEALLPIERQLPAIYATSVAMARLLESKGVNPSALLGHSNGEYAAACLAGVLSFEDGLGLVIKRSLLMSKTAVGTMLAVPLPEAEVQQLLGTELDLAAVNGPELCVLSGSKEALSSLKARLEERDIDARMLDIDIAAHSRTLDPILEDFRAFLRTLTLKAPQKRVISSRTGEELKPSEATSPDYWVEHLRQTVRFGDALNTLAGDNLIAVECGPGRAMQSFAKQCAGIKTQAVIGTMRHREEEVNDRLFFIEVLGRLWSLGLDLDFSERFDGRKTTKVRLPTYAFARQRYFIEPGTLSASESHHVDHFEDVSEFGYVPRWLPKDVEGVVDPGEESWLIFLDDAGVGERVASDLRARGAAVTTVVAGDAFATLEGDRYILSPERGREGYDQLVQDLMQRGRAPSRILHLWLTTADETFRPGSSFFHRNLERGFYSLFFLLQSLADESAPRPVHITTVSNGMHAVGDESVLYPEKAIALGPIKVGPREIGGITMSGLDLRLPVKASSVRETLGRVFGGLDAYEEALDELASRLLEEASTVACAEIAALRDGRRYVRQLVRRELEEVAELPELLRENGTYLVTGGLGGLGLVAAEEIARRCGGRLILLSRRGLPSRSEWDEYVEHHGESDRVSQQIERVRRIEAAGAEVLVLAGDVTNFEEMNDIATRLRQRYGSIHGVIHTAGVVADDLIQTKNLPDIERVFSAKVHGTQVLDEIFSDADFLLVYSSTSSETAPAGQVDYVGANAFLDAFVHTKSGHRRNIAIGWGIWRQVGMAAAAMDATDLSAGPESLPATTRPLFDGRRRDALGRLHLFGVHSPDTHWIYDEHRIKPVRAGVEKGLALIPGTGYLELIAQAMSELEGSTPFEIEELYFIRPLQIDDGTSREVRVRTRRNEAGYAIEVRSACEVEGKRAWQLHAQANVVVGGELSRTALDVSAITERCLNDIETGSGLRSAQEKHLDFGGRWRVLDEVRFGDGEALAKLRLPANAVKDLEQGYLLHPGAMDLATGFAMNLIEGYASEEVWVPVSYGTAIVHGPLEAELYSHVMNAKANRATDDFATFNIVIANRSGEALVEIQDFSIRRMPKGVEFGKVAPPTRADVELEPGAAGEERTLSPAEERLKQNLERGITPEQGAEGLIRALALGEHRVLVSSLDVRALEREAGMTSVEADNSSAKFARPELDSEYVAPRDDVERTLVSFWEDLLGVENVGVQDSFFDLGGHSLIAVRLFAKIKKAFRADFPISVLFEAPTIEACADLIREASPELAAATEGDEAAKPRAEKKAKRRYTHLVSMHPGEGGDRTPFFLVAGMFGNVLNLRHLAQLIGTDRPFYGLQAKGLYGNDAPHETFEEMATAYLEEIRTVRPHGPYLLGGFSGGGYTALEMAKQLKAAGEEVSLLVMLDTPAALLPKPLSLKDRATIQLQRIESKGAMYFAEWAQNRVEWELGKIRSRIDGPEERGETEFHNEAIEAAFRRALARYEIPQWEQPLVLFRPPLEKAYVLGPGRILNHDREYVYQDNGWGHYCDFVQVHEVPGDHDSMVLEPNVRVMARKLRAIIESAENQSIQGAAE